MNGKSRKYRLHGLPPYRTAVVHGGPGAIGSVGDLASELGRHFGTIEPFQTQDSIPALITELEESLPREPVILIGHSWGAWLSYLFSAEYPDRVKMLILLSSAPFEEGYAPEIEKKRLKRLDSQERKEYFHLLGMMAGKNAGDSCLSRFAELMEKTDSYALAVPNSQKAVIDLDLFRKIWGEASSLRKNGGLIRTVHSLFPDIIIIHGEDDPHPFEGVLYPLEKAHVRIASHLLARCGHYPWREKYARKSFYRILLSCLRK